MDPQRWERVAGLFEEASGREPGARSAFLAEACAGDEELQREVLSLLNQDPNQPDLLETISDWSGSARLPAFVGAYRILGLIGEGGMGTVYEAEQENPRRKVAIKVIRAGLTSPEIVRRFHQESRALARLQHPGIAQIYEAGIAEGKPYFAMERIRGQALLQYAVAERLSIAQRVELTIKICEAIQHAHANGIIHRDLKPGNILVDESGQPKILDFGVARFTDAESKTTRGTDLGRIVGTLAYMSPEQLAGGGSQVDRRSDVYALGVILYELLAGRAPYETSGSVPEAIRAIREDSPFPLRSVNRELGGDLQTVAAKALEKDPTRRYATAADLAVDLRRHLANQPILARPPGALYLARKFVLRHKALSASTLSIFTVLVLAVVISAGQAARARRAEQTARAVNEFLQNDLLSQAGPQTQAGPSTTPDRDLKVRTALDRAAERIKGKFDAQPEVEAAIRQTIGNAYQELGLYTEAATHLERAVELRRRMLSKDDPATMDSMHELAELYLSAGRYGDAEKILEPLVEMRRRRSGVQNEGTLRAMNDLAGLIHMRGDYAHAAPLRELVLREDRKLMGDLHPHTLTAIHNLASSYSALGEYQRAAPLFEEAVKGSRVVFGDSNPSTLSSMSGLGNVYRDLGRFSEAENLQSQVLDLRRQALGEEHPHTILAVSTLAGILLAEGLYPQAEKLLVKGLETARRVIPSHPYTIGFLPALAEVNWKQGRLDKAESLFRAAADSYRKTLGPTRQATARASLHHGRK
jgi:serine/threonine protein kinase